MITNMIRIYLDTQGCRGFRANATSMEKNMIVPLGTGTKGVVCGEEISL